MRTHAITALAAAAGLLAALALSPPVRAASDHLSAAIDRARGMESTARVLRNGATAGASRELLAAEAARLRADLDALVASHQEWAASLPAGRRTALAPQLAQVDEGCARMREALRGLDQALAAEKIDRKGVQSAGRLIGRQALQCRNAIGKVATRSGS